ncbi:MAG: outer membrane lipid asymmetry maintenance protein MlaD [Alphaproteobacteria bacterium]|jgi:phospholipid/cholesterol/gamma-HCH transport system substrate-binding protein|nr:outer membrane lipid asymmetry maintenance protein MlaD [Candidatus Jidaibacter sp.]
MSKNLVETLVGLLVLLVAGYFLYYAYSTTQVVKGGNHSYTLFARFDKADGVNLGSDVKISGIRVGKVVEQELDAKTFQAVLVLKISGDIKLPIDTGAEIIGNGLLGEKYVSLSPGSDDEYLENNSNIEFTQSAISLESLIGKFMFGVDKPKGDAKNDAKDKK